MTALDLLEIARAPHHPRENPGIDLRARERLHSLGEPTATVHREGSLQASYRDRKWVEDSG
jgi:hypothetical protein